MGVFILDEVMQNVVSEKTRYYLREVISCYYNNNYRSCIVSLYTTVIYNFIDKLIKLRDLYNDADAHRLLNEIENMQQSNSYYSDVEKAIIE